MFYEKFLYLCHNKGISPTKFLTEYLGMSSGNLTKWKDGATPKANTIKKIASYFDVSSDFLIGEEQKNKPTDTVDELDELDIKIVKLFSQLTPQNKQLALAQIGAILNAQDNQLV